MSYANTKNYTEQGGERTVIGGELVFERTSAGVLPNMSTPAADANASAVRSALIALVTNMKDYGLMAADPMALTYAAVTSDAETDRAYNTAKIGSVTVDNEAHTITVALSEKVSALKDFDARGVWGVHKWLGIGLTAGVALTSLQYNGTMLIAEDVTEATNVGLSADYFVRWIAADLVLAGDNTQKTKDKFVLWSSGYAQTEYKLIITEPSE